MIEPAKPNTVVLSSSTMYLHLENSPPQVQMKSPEPAKPTMVTLSSSTISTADLENSPQLQESPFTAFLNNLSPIDFVKAPYISQAFLTLNSPPLVFTSPHINPNPETGFLLRSPTLQVSNYVNDFSNPKDIGIQNNEEVGFCYPDQVDTYLVDSVERDCVNMVDANNANDTESGTNAHLSSSKQGQGDLQELGNTVNDEASQQRRMSRRCLQFEETRPKAVGNRSCSVLENIDDPNLSNPDRQVLVVPEDADAAVASNCIVTESLETTDNNKQLVEENVDGFDEQNSQSPKKKKKKVSFAIEGDGCKRCNCKKTSCLKLYCECFASRIYCSGPCSCQGCKNRAEYEDTVLEARHHIEARNPLAFAPKIVKGTPANSTHNREDVNGKMPASARHKRGCNCKKSMCLKKYCECYQANVGCSRGCRCEDCKNIYGKKEEYGEIMTSKAVIGIDRRDSISTGNQTDPFNLHKLTPIMPSFQSTDHGHDGPKSKIIVRKDNSCDAKASSSPTNAHKSVPGCIASEMTGYLSSQFYSQSLGPASLISSEARKLIHTQPLPLGPGTGRLSSGGSPHWRNTPTTPMIRQLNETKIQEEPFLGNYFINLWEGETLESMDLTPMKSGLQ